MEVVNSIALKSLSQWETVFNNRPELTLEGVHMHNGGVTGAFGTVKANKKEYSVKWLGDGRCYYKGKRVRKYDVKLL